jgi:glycine oxidase
MELPILIVGQGLAGSVLALSLFNHGVPCHIADKQGMSVSSRVAAGLYNPIVFKRLTLGWRADEALAAVNKFYKKAERQLGIQILNESGIYRIHGSEDEVKLWAKRRDGGWEQHLGQTESAEKKPWLKMPFGGAMVHSGGSINTLYFLDEVRTLFANKSVYHDAEVIASELVETEGAVFWKNTAYEAVVFCEGTVIEKNTLFEAPLLKPAKGEVLLIEAPDLPIEIFNGKVYGVPLGNHKFKVGATYEWDAPHAEPTTEKYDELVYQLNKLLNVKFSVVKHEAGIRPSTPTRRPLFLRSKQISRVFAFNGLGTKGVLLAPMLADEIAQFFKSRKPVHPEFGVNLQQ